MPPSFPCAPLVSDVTAGRALQVQSSHASDSDSPVWEGASQRGVSTSETTARSWVLTTVGPGLASLGHGRFRTHMLLLWECRARSQGGLFPLPCPQQAGKGRVLGTNTGLKRDL